MHKTANKRIHVTLTQMWQTHAWKHKCTHANANAEFYVPFEKKEFALSGNHFGAFFPTVTSSPVLCLTSYISCTRVYSKITLLAGVWKLCRLQKLMSISSKSQTFLDYGTSKKGSHLCHSGQERSTKKCSVFSSEYSKVLYNQLYWGWL